MTDFFSDVIAHLQCHDQPLELLPVGLAASVLNISDDKQDQSVVVAHQLAQRADQVVHTLVRRDIAEKE